MLDSDGSREVRVWDRFLTDRDHALLELNWRKPSPMGFGERPVLLVIDDYRGSLGDQPLPILEAVREWPNSCGEEGWVAVARTRRLLDVARSSGVHVVYTTNDPEGPPWGVLVDRQRANLSDDQWLQRYEIVDELKPEPDDVVIEKTSASGFFGTPLITYLTRWRIDTVLVCGNSTSGCVRATAVDAASYRFRLGIVEDCCFDRTEATHAINLFDLDQKYGDVVSAGEAERYLRSLGGS